MTENRHPIAHGAMGPQQRAAVHQPCISMPQTYLGRYVHESGDLSARIVVIRYAHLWDGEPVWHASCMVRMREGPPKPRAEWTRRDTRAAVRATEHLIEKIGLDPTFADEDGGMHVAFATHRLRRLTAGELLHTPVDFRSQRAVIDLGADRVS